MSKPGLTSLKPGEHYTASELDSFISTTEAVLLSTNGRQLFTESDREYKVTQEFDGFFEHSQESAEKQYYEKKVYLVEKV
ncbi:hypothetical protein [Evansella clarkii]|uniref:hypothetical protein n=1 Tax=Evansella clarkii TaxID=79879 RepID=UPI000B444529|nr:hypothetical protein [Evansella clarkii]